MEVNNLPLDIQNKIFYVCEHPIAQIFKEAYDIRYDGYRTFRKDVYFCSLDWRNEEYWNDLACKIKRDTIQGRIAPM